jgi:hypothetical protein
MLESRQTLGVLAADALDVIGALLEIGSEADGPLDRFLPLRLPRRGVPVFLGEIYVDCPADNHRARRTLRSGALIEANRLTVVEIDLSAIHDV